MDQNSSDEASRLFGKTKSKLFCHRSAYRKKPTINHPDPDSVPLFRKQTGLRKRKTSQTGHEGLDDRKQGEELNVHEIGANWIQKKIKQRGYNAQRSMEIAEEVFSILAQRGEDNEVERKLLLLSGDLGLDFVKFLSRNRLKIVWCTRLMRAVVEEQRREIVEEMMRLGSDHVALLEKLCLARGRVKKRIRNEARG